MPNYNKEQLLEKEEAEILSIAESLGIKAKNIKNKEDLVYQILDEQAVQSAAQKAAVPKKRTRIVKKETDRVYSASQKSSDNPDNSKKEKETEGNKGKDWWSRLLGIFATWEFCISYLLRVFSLSSMKAYLFSKPSYSLDHLYNSWQT